MSLWIRRRDQAGRVWYFAIDVPLGIIIAVIGFVMAILLGSLAAAPIRTLLFCFSIAAAGSILIGVAKWSLFRQGRLLSFGSAGMSRVMRALYRTGWLLVTVGTAITLLAIGLVLRH